ncbi:MAG: hypothetical protein FWG87_10500 [Defluviitaleaceae bacterium]|nr:hypothetical protein [Defluviitaleaceae bacterium]
MDNKLFRKTALDKISSPEQLTETMKVAGSGVWFILAALAVTFAAFFAWGVLGSIPETVDIGGTALALQNKPLAVYCFLPIDETKPLAEGMSVRVSPDYAAREQYGYIYGTVQSIGGSPVTADQLRADLGEATALVSLPAGNVIEVVVNLETLENGKPRWSTARGADIDVTVGSACTLTVITAERKPYELMFR